MLSLYKLEKLPRNQRLRKIAKIFAEAENRLCADTAYPDAVGSKISPAELLFFADVAKSLAKDTLFLAEVQVAFKNAAAVFAMAGTTTAASAEAAIQAETASTAEVRRALNNAKHLLLNETGRSQADWDFTGSDGRLDPAKRRVFEGMLIYLEDIRSPFNVGAMFRTAESFGAEKIFLSPFCADPNHLRAHRTAMGCVDVLPWERRELFTAAENQPLAGPIFALETGGTPLAEFPFPRQGLLIAGSEELGISPTALAVADSSLGRVSIPCYGVKGSLNVSVAFGIVMQAWAKAIAGSGYLDTSLL